MQIRSKPQRTVPVSLDRNEKLRKHMLAIGKSQHGDLTATIDALIDGYLTSPLKELREREYENSKKAREELGKLRKELGELKQRLPKT